MPPRVMRSQNRDADAGSPKKTTPMVTITTVPAACQVA